MIKVLPERILQKYCITENAIECMLQRHIASNINSMKISVRLYHNVGSVIVCSIENRANDKV